MAVNEEAQLNRRRDFGRALLLESLAAPFFWIGAQAMIDEEFEKMAVAYLIGLIFAVPGLLVLGVILPSTRTQVGVWISTRIGRIADDVRWWILIWLLLLGYLGGPNFVARINAARARFAPPPVISRSATISSPGKVSASVCVQAPPPPPPDLRLVPVEADPTFFSPLPRDTHEVFQLCCFPYEAMSCNIAVKYRSRLTEYFTPSNDTCFSLALEGADFKGIRIVTRSEKRDGLPGALILSSQLRHTLGADPLVRLNPSLKPNVFQIWIGGKP
jgi:hypothetical protein